MKKKRKSRKVDAKLELLTSKLLMNHESSFSNSGSEVNFDAFPVRAKAVLSKVDQDTATTKLYHRNKRVIVIHSVNSSEDPHANVMHVKG